MRKPSPTHTSHRFGRCCAWTLALGLTAVVVAGCAVAPSAAPATTSAPVVTPTPTIAPITADVTPADADLPDIDIPQRDLADIRLRLDPQIGNIPTVAADARNDYAVGDRTEFSVLNSNNAATTRRNAELIHRNDVAYAWVEVDQAHDSQAIVQAVDTFAEEIYPVLTRTFGRESAPGIDGDPRLHILFTTGVGDGAAAFFMGSDTTNRLALPTSNEKEMFYVNLDWFNRMGSQQHLESALAHEFQHMVHFSHDRNEEVWLSEGLSKQAETVAGYKPLFYNTMSYLMNPDLQLNTWLGANSDNQPHYAQALLFVNYLANRFGPEILSDLVTESSDGIEGVRRILAREPYNADFTNVFADWILTNQVTPIDAGENLDGLYWYTDFEAGAASREEPLLADGNPISTTVSNFGVDYIPIVGEGDLTVRFAGEHVTRIIPAQAAAGKRFWWSNRADMSDMRLTRKFDFSSLEPGVPLSLTASLWWDIEPDYDFGYLMASGDGKSWKIVPGNHTAESPDTANNLGPGYTGKSAEQDDADELGWVTETWDLSEYSGGPAFVRFEYITDEAVTHPGWLVDNVRIDAFGYSEDFEQGDGGWSSEGWLLTDGYLAQRWLLQALDYENGKFVGVRRIETNANGDAEIAVPEGEGQSTLIAVSGMTEGSTEPALYSISAAPSRQEEP